MSLSRNLQQVLLASLTVMFFCADAQSLKDHLQKGDRNYERKDYEGALKNYLEALALDGNSAYANFKAGVSLLNEESYHKAARYLERAYQLRPDVDPNIEYHLGIAHQEDHQYAKARKYFEAFKAKYKNLAGVANQKIRACILGDSLMKIPSNAEVRPLGAVNTTFDEFFPILTPKGAMLIFTSNRTSDAYQIKSATNYEDVYYSELKGGQWIAPKTIGGNINVKLNDAAVSLSADGKTLLLYYEDGRGDIYTSTLENSQWSQPVPLNRFVNHPHYRESAACVSPDGKQLYFSSNRPGGKGGYDIYVCKLGTNGQWGRPSNLGSVINTRGDEEFPFLHADGVTLYFSSNGVATLGGHDIFKSTLRDDRWTTPQNLGYPINTGGYEGNFILSEDKLTGYFSSRRGDTRDNTDLYEVTFSASNPVAAGIEGNSSLSVKPDTSAVEKRSGTVTTIRGTVIDAKSSNPLEATITVVDHADKHIVSRIKTDRSGNFVLNIRRGGNFGITTVKPGYLFNSMNFNLPAGAQNIAWQAGLPSFGKYREIATHILMVKAEVGSKVVLKNIFFDINASVLKKESLSELENIRDLLLQNPQWRIRINGHTDSLGDAKANMALSLQRAESVVQYLIGAGISSDRLQAKGYGAERPLVSNDDEAEGRELNRRTEIEIVE